MRQFMRHEQRLKPLIFEGFMAGGVAAGGQLTTTTDVENYAGFHAGIQGPQLMVYMRKQSTSSRCQNYDGNN